MVYLDLFSGIGGFHLGLQQAGFKFSKTYFSEIDKHAISNYKLNFPDAEYIGDVNSITGNIIERPDVVTFGSPCQDFSLAGFRKGLDGDRSSLIRRAIEIVREYRPKVFIWENVKGVFSSNGGADFTAILQEFASIGGYTIEWKLINSNTVVPQNRERVYLVGYLIEERGDSQYREILNNIPSEAKANRDHERSESSNHNGLLPCSVTIGLQKAYIGDFINIAFLTGRKNEYKRVRHDECFTLDTKGMISVVRADKDRMFLTVNDCYQVMPIEMERLQGFEDDWTKFGNDGKENSRSRRLHMCGNSVTVPVIKNIGIQIKDGIFNA